MRETTTVIGSGAIFCGNLEGDADVTVEGRFEGSIAIGGTLTVGDAGIVNANVQVSSAVIDGSLVGDIVAERTVQITGKGSVVGDIRAPRVVLMEGSSFKGSIDMGDFPEVRKQEERYPETYRTEVPPPRKPSFAPHNEMHRERVAPRESQYPTSSIKEPPPMRMGAVPPPRKAMPERVERNAPPPKVRSIGKVRALQRKPS